MQGPRIAAPLQPRDVARSFDSPPSFHIRARSTSTESRPRSQSTGSDGEFERDLGPQFSSPGGSSAGYQPVISSSAAKPTRLGLLKRHARHNTCGGLRSMIFEEDTLDTPKENEEVNMFAILSGIGLCANTVVGAGTLALPFTMSLVGSVLYHVVCGVVLALSSISLKWLVEVAEALPGDVPRSYEGIAHHFLGPKADMAISSALLFGGFALTMAYMLFITTSCVSVLSGLMDDLDEIVPLENLHLFISVGVGLGVVLPLLMLKDISALRLTSVFAICALFTTSSYVVMSGWTYVSDHGIHEGVVAVQVSAGLFEAIPMCVSSFSCHILVIPIYDSLGNGRSPAVMGKVLVAALSLAALVYEIVGIAGYLHFGNGVHGNILENLAEENSGSPMIMIVNMAMAVTLVCHMPCVVWPLRSCIISAYHCLVLGFDGVDDGGSTTSEWRTTSLVIMVAVLVMVHLLPSIKTALSIVGSIGGACIVFIFPAAFRLAVVKDLPLGSAWLSWSNTLELGMMGIGLTLGILCFSMSVMNSISHS